MIKIYNCSCS